MGKGWRLGCWFLIRVRGGVIMVRERLGLGVGKGWRLGRGQG